MHQICFHIGSRPIYWYGVMVACGFLLAVVHWSLLGRKQNLPAGFGSDLGFWVMLSGILGARIAYVLANLPEFISHPVSIIRIDEGGLVYYGGFICALFAIILFARIKKLPVWGLGDFVITGLPLGHALGRLGCFLNGCCFGCQTQLPWGISFPEDSAPWYRYGAAALHPTQLYETLFNLALYAFLLWVYARRKRDGSIVALYLLIYPVFRFLVEFVRGDERMIYVGLTLAQLTSLALFATGLILWVLLPKKVHNPLT
ncbi:MAG: prolipoprotein diacylglyceryl transferase [Spartobacteria bacterium]|nr:prolipoprotein diacylglyceryl transferase [Spartobacteria bacterium]